MESKSVDTRRYRELGATLSCQHAPGERYGNEPWLKAAVRKEFVDDNRVKVNNAVNDLSGRRGIYQAAIKAYSVRLADISGRV